MLLPCIVTRKPLKWYHCLWNTKRTIYLFIVHALGACRSFEQDASTPVTCGTLRCGPWVTCGMCFESCVKCTLSCFMGLKLWNQHLLDLLWGSFLWQKTCQIRKIGVIKCFVWMLKIYHVPVLNVNSACFMHKMHLKIFFKNSIVFHVTLLSP